MHNGQVGGFEQIRRTLMMKVDSGLFPKICGSTNSELFFYLLLSNGYHIYAIRYASDAQAPSLFYASADSLVHADGVLIASEPLGTDAGPWQTIPQSHWLHVSPSGFQSGHFSPQ